MSQSRGPDAGPDGENDEPRRLTPLFRSVFQGLPAEENLIEVFACAYQLDSLVQGKLYLTEHYLCFHSNLVGWETVLTLKFSDITSVEKIRTALVIPNAISLTTAHHQYTFTSFISREQAFVKLRELWQRQRSAPAGDLSDGPARSDRSTPSSPHVEDEVDDVIQVGTRQLTAVEDVAAARVVRGDGEASGSATAAAAAAASGGDGEGGCRCGDQHLEREIVCEVFPCDVETLYNLLFGAHSAFLTTFLARDCVCSDLNEGEWSGGADGTSTRLLTYVKALKKNSLGPTTALVHEQQQLVTSDPSTRRVVAVECRTPQLPYGDAFCTQCRYCIVRHGSSAARLLITADVVWQKSVMAMMKNYITKSSFEGMETQLQNLARALRTYIEKGEMGPAAAEAEPLKILEPHVARGRDRGARNLTVLLGLVLVLAGLLLYSNMQLLARIARLEAAFAQLDTDSVASAPRDLGHCQAMLHDQHARRRHASDHLMRQVSELHGDLARAVAKIEQLGAELQQTS